MKETHPRSETATTYTYNSITSESIPHVQQSDAPKSSLNTASTVSTMTTDLLRPPILPETSTALHRSQLAPSVLSSLAPSSLPYPLSLLFESDSVEKWTALETLFYSCLQTGDNSSAKTCLDRLTTRFGAESERITGLSGIYHEATAENNGALEALLTRYRETIKEQPINMVIRKRQVTLLKSMGRTAEAMQALVELLDLSPVDAESWAEMAEMYFQQGMYGQAIYCYEDVLLTTPNAWNVSLR
jgi:tetratricopeptide (TPR) repeat protein